MDREALSRLRAAITRDTDPNVILGVQEGIRLADDLLESTPLLMNAVGRDLRGHIRRAGIMFRIHDLCVRGDLPFKTQITSMPIGSWHWLEISAPGIRAHICHTDEPVSFPTDTPNRQDARLTNPQYELFGNDSIPPFAEVLKSVDTMYVWLSYGVTNPGELTHLCWGVPASDINVWLARENIFRKGTGGAFPEPPAPPKAPDATTRLRFHEHIEEALEKKDESEHA